MFVHGNLVNFAIHKIHLMHASISSLAKIFEVSCAVLVWHMITRIQKRSGQVYVKISVGK